VSFYEDKLPFFLKSLKILRIKGSDAAACHHKTDLENFAVSVLLTLICLGWVKAGIFHF
jgi:hypothetical protein